MQISMYKPKRPKAGTTWPEMKIVRIVSDDPELSTILVRYNYDRGQFQWICEEDCDSENPNLSNWDCMDGAWKDYLDFQTPEACHKNLKNAPKLMAALGKCF